MSLVSRQGFDASGQPVRNVADASAATDAVNWGQVQALLSGLQWKAPARAASTGNVSLTAPGASIDGVALNSGDRVLLRAQTAAAENGLYTWTGAAAALTRTSDANTSAKVTAAAVLIAEGATWADKAFTQNADGVTLGTTALTWVQFGGGTTSTPGDGLQQSGGVWSVKAKTGGSILVSSDGVAIDYSGMARTMEGTLGDGTATTFTVAHGFGKYVRATVFNIATGQEEWADPKYVDGNTVRFTFGTAPAAASYRFLITG